MKMVTVIYSMPFITAAAAASQALSCACRFCEHTPPARQRLTLTQQCSKGKRLSHAPVNALPSLNHLPPLVIYPLHPLVQVEALWHLGDGIAHLHSISMSSGHTPSEGDAERFGSASKPVPGCADCSTRQAKAMDSQEFFFTLKELFSYDTNSFTVQLMQLRHEPRHKLTTLVVIYKEADLFQEIGGHASVADAGQLAGGIIAGPV